MKITIETIPHNKQRYNTCGDWIFDKDGNLHITVSNMDNIYFEALIGLHEMIEAIACKKHKVKEKDVTKFDMEFEKNRKKGNTGEPGDSPAAPYHREHKFATVVEKMMASILGIKWDIYNSTVENL